ncbi:hypothetical protein [Neisseria sp.]|uniref:hypothetical protein n=1 Tax=Neisseria sp. TaxID=192066 RepID=UPI0026DD4204|nr:hypothetical protein [Neisseria sp.]MDO4227116.1 hypothetical protein [Neisseria sp.]
MTATQNKKEPTWYEKTVEYAFVRKFLNLDAMPLSGTAEKIGDTMFYEGNHFYIIEFKRGKDIKSEITSEQNKYLNYEKSMKTLCEHNREKPHYVVFGKINDQQEWGLFAAHYVCFVCRKYKHHWPLTSLSTDLKPITSKEQLKEYLQLLINEKESSSGSSSSVDYGNTLIVDKDGNACSLSDREGLAELNLVFPINKPPQQNLRSPKRKGP